MWNSEKVAPQKWSKGQGHQGIGGLDRSLAPLLCPQRGQVSRYLAYPSSLLLLWLWKKTTHPEYQGSTLQGVQSHHHGTLGVNWGPDLICESSSQRRESRSSRIVSKITVLNFLQKKHILAWTIISLSIYLGSFDSMLLIFAKQHACVPFSF